jgi:hypothetical protein
MKTIFKGNNFSIIWNIFDSSTDLPFDFIQMAGFNIFAETPLFTLHTPLFLRFFQKFISLFVQNALTLAKFKVYLYHV